MKEQRWEESEKRRGEERRSEKRKSQKKENESARKGRKVTIHYAAVVRSTSGSQHVKNIARCEHFGNLRFRKSAHDCGAKHISNWKKHWLFGAHLEVQLLKTCTPLWRDAHVEVKMVKTPTVRITFGSWDVEKVHAVVAWSTCRSQNVTPHSDHFCTFKSRFSRQAQWILHLAKIELNVRVLYGFVAVSDTMAGRAVAVDLDYTALHQTTRHSSTTATTSTRTTTTTTTPDYNYVH